MRNLQDMDITDKIDGLTLEEKQNSEDFIKKIMLEILEDALQS